VIFLFEIKPKNLKWISYYRPKLLQNQAFHLLFASHHSEGFTLFRYADHTQAKSTDFTCLTAVLGRQVVLEGLITNLILDI